MKIFKLKIALLFCSALLGQIRQIENLGQAEVKPSLLAVDLDETAVTKIAGNYSKISGITELLDGSNSSIGVTARYPRTKESTSGLLKKLGIKFNSPVKDRREIAVWDGFTPKTVLYEDGVLYCGNCPKGKALAALFALEGKPFPDKVTAFDDKMENLKSLSDACKAQGAKFSGFHVQSPTAVRKAFRSALRDITPKN